MLLVSIIKKINTMHYFLAYFFSFFVISRQHGLYITENIIMLKEGTPNRATIPSTDDYDHPHTIEVKNIFTALIL